MPQVIRCGKCQMPMQVGDDAAGKQFRCPSCKTVFTVPAVQAPAAARAAVKTPAAAASGAAAVATPPPLPAAAVPGKADSRPFHPVSPAAKASGPTVVTPPAQA